MGYIPKLLTEPSDDAKIPVWQADGSIRYVNSFDFEWLLKNRTETTDVSPSKDQESQS